MPFWNGSSEGFRRHGFAAGLCTQHQGPALLYADDPEKWTPGSWAEPSGSGLNAQADAVMLQGGAVLAGSPGTLISFLYQNNLGKAGHLYITLQSLTGGNATAQLAESVDQHTGVDETKGAAQTVAFLNAYVGQAGNPISVSPSPTIVRTYPVSNANILEGEVYIYQASGPMTITLYADDCSAGCISGTSGGPLTQATHDGFNRRGFFQYGSFLLNHNQTSTLTGADQYSYIEVSKAQSSLPPLYNGMDPTTPGYYLTDAGDYGAIIDIEGQNPNSALKQRWNIEPRGGSNNAYAFYLAGMVDGNGSTINGSYAVPSSGTISSTSQGGYFGTTYPGYERSILFIPSGDDTLPARIYYGLH